MMIAETCVNPTKVLAAVGLGAFLLGACSGGQPRASDGGTNATDANATDAGAVDSCSDDVCGPVLTQIAAPRADCGSILRLAPARGDLYWTDDLRGTVNSTVGRIESGQNHPTLITWVPDFDDPFGTIYWLTGFVDADAGSDADAAGSGASAYTILGAEVLTANAVPRPMATATTTISAFAISADGTTLFFATGPNIVSVSNIRAPITDAVDAGTLVTTVATVGANIGGLGFIDDQTLAYTTDTAIGAVKLVPGRSVDCGATGDGGASTPQPCSVLGEFLVRVIEALQVGSGGDVFWADNQFILRSSVGSNVPDTIASAVGPIMAFAVSDAAVYFADTGNIFRSPLIPNSKATKLARTPSPTVSIAVDDTRVYFSTADCAIFSMAR